MPDTSSQVLGRVGAQLARAREAAGRSMRDCARLIGVSARRYAAYESGEREPMMPQLEQLALYLQVPIEDLFRDVPFEPLVPLAEDAAEIMALRAKIIGARLRKARAARGELLEDAAAAVQVTPQELVRHELAARPMRLGTLLRMMDHYALSLRDLLDLDDASVEAPSRELQMGEAFAHLPPDVREFLLNPDALPYLRAGMKLRGLTVKDLRRASKAMDKLAGVVKRGK